MKDNLFNPGRCPNGCKQRSSIIPKGKGKQSVDDQNFAFKAEISIAPCIYIVVEFVEFCFPVQARTRYR